ncbi:MAG: outer-membrane lipoprotein carrier protein LolA, partial [Planctomycetota bacterium]
MKRPKWKRWIAVASVIAIASAATAAPSPGEGKTDALRLVDRVVEASATAATLSADFVYTVTSAKQQQAVTGSVKLAKPNLARFRYEQLLRPAFPAPIASDGERLFTFTPESFDEQTRRFKPGPFDPLLGAAQASGLVPGGGRVDSGPVEASGKNLLLWDFAPVQAFFDAEYALARNVYVRDRSKLELEKPQTIDGVRYQVLFHRFEPGNIAGGESSAFDQRLYVAPDGLIHMYLLEFTSAGAGGAQMARLKNVRLNEPIDESAFEF